ncbi:MAG: pilus assembly protein PilM [Bdellovibrionota bacterium]
MQTYLGLDIGTYSIKAVVLKINFDSYSIESTIEQEISQQPDVDEKTLKINALRSILSTLKDKTFDSIYASLGCQFTVMKMFDLNNVKRGDRQKVIESEFDLLGLFNLDDYALEYHTIKFDNNYAKLLAILINKPFAKILIDMLTECELNVRIIDIDNIVLLNLVHFLPHISAERGTELFLDFGHSKTSFTVIQNHKVINTRVFNVGGNQLTNLIKNKLNISYDEAQQLKHQVQPTDKHYQDVQNVMQSFFEEICFEIKRTIKSINVSEFVKIDRIFVVGGSSKYDGLQRIFETHLEIKLINLVLENRNLKFHEVDFQKYSQAIAAVFRGNLIRTNSKINIRHGDLALISNYEKIMSEVAKYAKIAAVLFIVLIGTYFLRSILFQHRITEIKTQYKNEIVKMFSTEPKELKLISGKSAWDFEDYSNRAMKLIQTSIADKKALLGDLSLNKISTPLQLLNEISIAVPKSIHFEVVDFKYQEDILYIEADTNSSKSVEAIVSKLSSIKMLTKVTKKSENNKAGSDGQIVHFAVTANVLSGGE